MSRLIFFYGTLMQPFNRPGRQRIDSKLIFRGHGTITAALFDLGLYPAAVPIDCDGARVRGELHEMKDADVVLGILDEIEGYNPAEPDTSLYTRRLAAVTLEGDHLAEAWVYFYNAQLGRAERIQSGDYLEYLKGR